MQQWIINITYLCNQDITNSTYMMIILDVPCGGWFGVNPYLGVENLSLPLCSLPHFLVQCTYLQINNIQHSLPSQCKSKKFVGLAIVYLVTL